VNSSSSSGSDDNPGVCNHCKKAPEREEHLSRCSRCHHAWYCSKVRHACVLSQAGCRVGQALHALRCRHCRAPAHS
jgi:hypothetical protein